MKNPSILLLLFIVQTIQSQSIYDKSSVKEIMDKVNTYQLENPWQEIDDNWIRGTYYAGVMACYKATNNEKYLQWMDHVFWDVFGELYDPEAHLFYRDKRYKPSCSGQGLRGEQSDNSYSETANGKKVIWSRGNGWVIAGIVRILQHMPRDYSSYVKYETLLKEMAEALKNCQSEEGFWYLNLADPQDVHLKETSGTSFFIYALAYGVNNGILDEKTYLPVIEKAWKSVYEAVSDEGKVQWGQRVGDRPVVIQKEDSHEYVSGTFLLAASEIYKLNRP